MQEQNEAAERKALEAVRLRQEHLARLEFERSGSARDEARRLREQAAAAPTTPAATAPPPADKQGKPEKSSAEAEALYDRAVKMLEGIGADKDAQRAVQVLKEAAEAGHSQAAFVVGRCYLLGDGVAEDTDLAAQWLTRAADAPGATPKAQTALAMLLLYERNELARARHYFELAAKKGDQDAAKELELLSSKKSVVADKKTEQEEEPRRVRFWWDRTHELNERKNKA